MKFIEQYLKAELRLGFPGWKTSWTEHIIKELESIEDNVFNDKSLKSNVLRELLKK